MNILCLTANNPYGKKNFGGAETSTRLLAEKLAELGHGSSYMCFGVTPETQRTAKQAGVTLTGILKPRGQAYAALRWLARLLQVLQLILILRLRKIDVVYAFYELDLLERLLTARRFAPRTKIVMRMAGFHWSFMIDTDPALKAKYTQMFSQLDSLNLLHEALNPMMQKELDRLDMPDVFKRVFYGDIGTWAQVDRQTPYKALDRTPFQILMASRFTLYQKRQDILIEALALLPKDADVHVTFVGNGPNLGPMKELAAARGVAEKITFQEFMPQAALWQKMLETNLLCHPADFEGVSKILLESMAVGLPLLTSDVDPINSYVTEGETGFLAPNTPQAWADRIAELMAAPEKLAHVSERGPAYVADTYSADRNVRIYEKEFRALSTR